MTARLIRHTDLLDAMPETWHCLICRGPQRKADGAPCERCGGWLHWLCYWPECLTDAERADFAAAQEADARAAERAGNREVEVTLGGRQYRLPAYMAGPSAVEDFLNRQIILCPGCRS